MSNTLAEYVELMNRYYIELKSQEECESSARAAVARMETADDNIYTQKSADGRYVINNNMSHMQRLIMIEQRMRRNRNLLSAEFELKLNFE